MNVREKTVKVEVERRIYISDDGQEFETADDCLRHERNRAEQNAWAIVDKLPHFSYSPDWIDCDYGWEWYYVSTDEELDAVREVLFNDDSSAYEYTPPAYPCWICCSNDSNGYGRIEGTVEQVFDALDELKKGVTDKMMENGRGFH